MRIKQISVNGLFGIFDHVIPLNMDERITIIHGPNGFGKTAILRILNSFLNSQYSDLIDIPFIKFQVEFDDSSSVEIIKNVDDGEDYDNNIVFTLCKPNYEQVSYQVKTQKPNNYKLSKIIYSVGSISQREQAYPQKYSEEIWSAYNELLPTKLKSKEEPDWLDNLKKNIHIRLIESQRLLNLVTNSYSKEERETLPILSTVSVYSDELAKLMQDKFKEYGIISQSLDRTFPLRVVKHQPSAELTDEQLRHQLNKLEATRSRLIEVGLLDKDEDTEFQIQPQDIDESTKNALSVYVGDVEKS